jgi:2-aminoadipate transaminase
MNYIFSDKVSALKPSAIREILKNSSAPGTIAFSAGNPSPDAFPVKEITEISNKLLTENPSSALQYGITEGYAPLRDVLKKRLAKEKSFNADMDELIITAGAQQVMDTATKSLCNEGDVIICEAPSFIGSLNSFRSYGAKLVGVPMEDDGMNTEALEEALKNNQNVRFIYVIPNFQNPTGITTSFEKRKEIYRLAQKYDTIILEDNPYGDLRFRGADIPSIKSLDTDGRVIYAGSFSKVLSPGMRVGYTSAPKEICSKMTVCKQVSDVHTNLWAQIIAYKFMTEYDFEGHLARIRNLYKEKAEFMNDCLNKYFKDEIKFTNPDGGLFVWCKLPQNIDTAEFCKKAAENKVAVVPSNAFSVDLAEKPFGFRITYSTPSKEEIEKGISILKEILDSYK